MRALSKQSNTIKAKQRQWRHFMWYKQEKNARKGFVSTEAHELDYMIKRKMQYTINNMKYILDEGDSFYYDACKMYRTKCLSDEAYEILMVYFFDEKKFVKRRYSFMILGNTHR